MTVHPPVGPQARAAIDSCWRSIGVRGDRSCEELATHSHCHNCPTYSNAALALLDRKVGEVGLEAVDRFAEQSEAEAGDMRSAVIFRIGSEWFALSMLICDEVVEAGRVHSLPHRRSPVVLGLTNIRGELVICLSLARLLGIDGDAEPTQRRLLVVRAQGGRLALPVDEVQHTHRCSDSELMPLPATMAGAATSYTRGVLSWRDRIIGCLNDDAVAAALHRCLA